MQTNLILLLFFLQTIRHVNDETVRCLTVQTAGHKYYLTRTSNATSTNLLESSTSPTQLYPIHAGPCSPTLAAYQSFYVMAHVRTKKRLESQSQTQTLDVAGPRLGRFTKIRVR